MRRSILSISMYILILEIPRSTDPIQESSIETCSLAATQAD